MILPFFRRAKHAEAVHAVYNAIVAQSRQPVFYTDYAVPDTVTGRFDMICLHTALVFRRLRSENEARAFSQELFDLFFKDMDRSLREMGVGDVSVPKKIEKMGKLFYGLLGKLTDALDRNDEEALRGVIDRNLFEAGNAATAAPLARYVLELSRRLESEGAKEIIAGRLDFGAVPATSGRTPFYSDDRP